MAIKGSARLSTVLGTAKPVETTSDGKARRHTSVKVTLVGVNLLKARLYAHLRLTAPADREETPHGLCHFPRYDDEFFQMLTAESLLKRQNRAGFATLEWVKTKPRNEALDCRVYAMAAALATGMERFTDDHWTARERLAGVSQAGTTATRPPKAPTTPTAPETAPTTAPTTAKPPQSETMTARTPFALKKPTVIRSRWMDR